MQIIIHLSPLSHELLKNRYGNVVKLDGYDIVDKILYNCLSELPVAQCDLPTSEARQMLTKQLVFDVGKRKSNITYNPWRIGAMIHEVHYDRILAVLEECHDLRIAITASIHRIYEKYNITEECLAIDTLVKRFYRFRKKKVTKSEKKSTRPVRLLSENIRTEKVGKWRISENDIIREVEAMTEKYHKFSHYHKNRGGKVNRRRVADLRCYVLYTKGNFRAEYIAKLTKRPLSTVYDAIKRVSILATQTT
jgi:hypothetical protein